MELKLRLSYRSTFLAGFLLYAQEGRFQTVAATCTVYRPLHQLLVKQKLALSQVTATTVLAQPPCFMVPSFVATAEFCAHSAESLLGWSPPPHLNLVHQRLPLDEHIAAENDPQSTAAARRRSSRSRARRPQVLQDNGSALSSSPRCNQSSTEASPASAAKDQAAEGPPEEWPRQMVSGDLAALQALL